MKTVFKIQSIILLISFVMFLNSCQKNSPSTGEAEKDGFQYFMEQFADLKILRYKATGFESLSLQQKELVYYLSQAALCGRDILFDQNYKHNLTIRRTLENIYLHYSGNRDSADFKLFAVYLKRVWFSSGIHHHYSTDKFLPAFSADYFSELVLKTDSVGLPLLANETVQQFIARLTPIIFDANIASKRINLDSEKGLLEGSSMNYYEGVATADVERYLENVKKSSSNEPYEYLHNSKTVNVNGEISEKLWVADGMYGSAIQQIVYWLTKAQQVAENDAQQKVIALLISFYQHGNLQTWNDYNIAWVCDLTSQVDFVNGFIEVYGDPIGLKGSWESVVNFRDDVATQRTQKISDHAQWFENHSPIDDKFKKKKVKGVSAKVINVVQLGGDCYPASPIGINLPNNEWIRKEYGSKSVTIGNLMHAHHQSSLTGGMLEEFAYSIKEIELAKKYGSIAAELHVDMHECLGHGSGQLNEGVSNDALKNYHSTLEEARADLFALYYIMDEKLIELGLIPSLEVGMVEYDSYIRSGLMTQLIRIELGKDIEESHMRNRQLIAKWVLEKGKAENVIEQKSKDGKTYFVVNDYQKLRNLFGELLKEVQRIKSEGDYNAGKEMVERYAVVVDKAIHQEVLERYKKLNLAPYTGFVNPVLTPVMENGKITDIKVSYNQSYTEQMLDYSKRFSFLPNYN